MLLLDYEFVGILLGGALALVGTFIAHWLNDQSLSREERDKIKSTLKALQSEITCLYQTYHEQVGQYLVRLEENAPLLLFYSSSQDYFTVYSHNAASIGAIPGHTLRESIINTYIKMKRLVDAYQTNNYLLEKYEYFNALALQTQNTLHQQQSGAYRAMMIEHTQTLRSFHDQLTQQIEQLTQQINLHLLPSSSIK